MSLFGKRIAGGGIGKARFVLGKEIYLGREGLPLIKEAKGGKNPIDLYCSCLNSPRTTFLSDILLLPAYPLLLDPLPPSLPRSRPEFDAVDTLYIVFEMVQVLKL